MSVGARPELPSRTVKSTYRMGGYGDTLLNPLFRSNGDRPSPYLSSLYGPHRSFRRCRRLGSAVFLDRLAALTGRDPRPPKRGPKPALDKGICPVKCHRNRNLRTAA